MAHEGGVVCGSSQQRPLAGLFVVNSYSRRRPSSMESHVGLPRTPCSRTATPIPNVPRARRYANLSVHGDGAPFADLKPRRYPVQCRLDYTRRPTPLERPARHVPKAPLPPDWMILLVQRRRRSRTLTGRASGIVLAGYNIPAPASERDRRPSRPRSSASRPPVS